LRFLGEVGADRDASARDAWRRAAAAHPAVRLRVGGLGVFPANGRPRVLWAGVEEISPGGALVSLASALEGAARAVGFEPEERPFRAHLTLARAARDGRATRRPEGNPLVASELLADEVVLFRSELGPGGARYSRIEGFSLGGGR
jgi:2'-5' RNA ligase